MASASSPSEATPLLAPLRPASPAPAEQVPNPSAAPCRQLSTVDGVSVVLSLQLGSGPFTSPALVLRAVAAAAAASAASSPPAEKVVAMERSALLIWLLAAVPTYAAASCYAELGSRVPANGGPLAWLVTAAESVARARGRRGRRCKWRCGSGDAGGDGHSGKTVAAVVGALGVWVVKPASAAVLALVIGSHVEGVLLAGGRGASGGAGYGWATGGGEWTAYLLRTAVAWLVVAVLAWVNVLGVRWSSRLTGNLLAWKVAGVGFVIIVGWWTLLRGSHQVTATPPIGTPSYLIEREASIPSRATIGNYADAMLQAMYAYSGWETVRHSVADQRRPDCPCLSSVNQP